MKRALTTLAIIGLLWGMTMTLSAESESTVAASETTQTGSTMTSGAQLDARIASLQAMPAAERRAHLKKLDPEERSRLWRELKKIRAAERGKEPRSRGDKLTPRSIAVTPKKAPTKAVGTIRYDSGPSSVALNSDAQVGNRFNTHTGIPVFASGTISTVQAVVVQGSSFSTPSVGFLLLGPQTGGGKAFSLFGTFTTLTASPMTATVTFSALGVNYTGSSFFVLFGDFSSSYVPVLGTGTTLGQGHHAVMGTTLGPAPRQGVALGTTAPSSFTLSDLTTLNAFVRATGNIVPVELMTFEIE